MAHVLSAQLRLACRLFSSEATVWYLDNIPKYLDGLDPNTPYVMVPHSNLAAPGHSDTYQCEHDCGDKVRRVVACHSRPFSSWDTKLPS